MAMQEWNALNLTKVTVFRAKGKYILTMRDFPTLPEAIEYITQTPADQQWSAMLMMKTDHQYVNIPGDGNSCNVNGPGYVGCFYD